MIEVFDLAGIDPEHRFSPYCWRTRMALAHKGLDAKMTPWHFGEQDRLPGAPKNDRVPVMVDAGNVIADSTAIAFYLEDKYHNGPTLFGGPGGEAHGRFIIAWADLVLIPAMGPILAPDVEKYVRPAARAQWRKVREKRFGITLAQARATREERLPALMQTLAPLRHTLASQAFLGGDEPSYADYAVFGAFQWARSVSRLELLTEDDPIHTWRESMLDLFDDLARDAPLGA
jgi:glutathione S-transferase